MAEYRMLDGFTMKNRTLLESKETTNNKNDEDIVKEDIVPEKTIQTSTEDVMEEEVVLREGLSPAKVKAPRDDEPRDDEPSDEIAVREDLLPSEHEKQQDSVSRENYATQHQSHILCFMWFKSSLLIGVWICMGMRMLVEFSTIPNLRVRLQTDVAGLSYAFAFGGIGGVFAIPVAAGSDRYGSHSDVILSILLIIAAVCNALKPFCTTLTVFAICDLIQEMAWTVIGAVGDSVITLIWGDKAGVPLHAIHFGFTVGALVGPLLSSAFIPDKSPHQFNYTQVLMVPENASSNVTLPNNFSPQPETKDDSRIEIAYLINSAFTVAVALVFFVLEFIRLPVKTKQTKKKSYKWKSIISPSAWAGGNISLGLFTIMLMNAFYICHLGAIKGPGMLLTAYAVDSHLSFTRSGAAALQSTTGIGGAISRFAMIFAAGYFSIDKLLIVLIHGQLFAAVLLLLFGTQSKLTLWIFSCLFGAVVRPIWASGYQWANEYMILVAFVFALTRMVSKVVDVGQTALQGYLYSNVAKESVFYSSVVYAFLNCLVLYAMLFLGKKYGTRHSKMHTVQ